MQYTRQTAIERMMKSYTSCYNIYPLEDERTPVVARCDYFEHSGRYVISKKAELWTADHEEFLYILNISHLTLESFEKWRDYVYEEGMKLLHIGPGHMSSFITPVFVCDTCDADARRALKKCRISKSFHFSLHGWMDVHTALVELSTGQIDANPGGRHTAKVLKKVLYSSRMKGDM